MSDPVYTRILVAVEVDSVVNKPDYVDLIEVKPGAPPARYVQVVQPDPWAMPHPAEPAEGVTGA